MSLFELYGTEEPPARLRRLTAGPLTAELDRGNLRYVRFHGTEVLRGIAFLVRDRHWGTCETRVTDLSIDEGPDGFLVTYHARCTGPDGAFAFAARIAGEASGALRFACEGRAEGDLLTNRLGFVVLHPVQGVAGRSMRVEHTDGIETSVELPLAIAPDQPVFDIRTLTHAPASGLSVSVRMEGDAFEMEDQRNWTDASFKTYIRPLAKPRPFIVPAGELQAQSIQVRIDARPGLGPRAAEPARPLEIGPGEGRVPGIGLAVGPDDLGAALEALSLLRAVAPQHLLARLDLRSAACPLAAYARLQAETDAALTLEVVLPGLDPQAELGQAAERVAAAGLLPDALVPSPARDLKTRPSHSLPPGEAPIEAILAAARAAFPGVAIGGGMLTSFTELNRNPPPAGPIDFVTHGTAANVHAADDIAVMETLETLPHVLASTRGLMGGLPYRLGPSGIGMRENPYGAAVADNPLNRRLPMARRDPRHGALFGAAWTLGYLAIAARYGVDAVTLAHLAGEQGLGEGGRIHPLAHVLRGIARAAGMGLCRTPLIPGTAALAFAGPAGPELWLANLGFDSRSLLLGRSGFCRAVVLDEATFERAGSDIAFMDHDLRQLTTSMLNLPPLAVARLIFQGAPEARPR